MTIRAKKLWLYSVVALIAILIVYSAKTMLRYQLEFREVENANISNMQSLITVDVDGNGHDEQASLNRSKSLEDIEHNYLLVSRYLAYAFSQFNTGIVRLSNLGKIDYDGDLSEEIYLTLHWPDKNKKSIIVKYVFAEEGRQRIIKEIDYQPIGKSNQLIGIDLLFREDIDNDGRDEIIGSYRPSDTYREIFALDADSLSIKWQFKTPIFPINIKPLDLDKDGKKELLIATMPYNNLGREDNGLDDSNVWFYVLDCYGNLVLKERLGGHPGFVDFIVSDEENNEVILIKSSFLNEDNYIARCKVTKDSISIIKRIDWQQQIPPSFLINSSYLVNNVLHLAIIDGLGCVHVYDSNLRELFIHEGISIKAFIAQPLDLDGDGHPNLVALTLNGEAVVFDHKLRIIGKVPDYLGKDSNVQLLRLLKRGAVYQVLTIDFDSTIAKVFSIRRKVIMPSIVYYILLSLIPVILFYQIRLRVIKRQNIALEKAVEIRTAELREKQQRIQQSIEYASLIQKSILPQQNQLLEAFKQHFVIWKPRDIVGGDFYWMFTSEKDEVFFAVIDCTGHGVPGALLSMTVNALLDKLVRSIGMCEPAAILNTMHREIGTTLHQNLEHTQQDGIEIALIKLDKAKRELCFSGASLHLLHYGSEGLEHIRGNKYGLGGLKWHQELAFDEVVIPYAEQSRIYLYSDGIIDQPQVDTSKIRRFGHPKWLEFIGTIAEKPLSEQQESCLELLDGMLAFHEQRDDITVIGIGL